MKTHLRLIAVLFLAGFALLGQSCAKEEFPPRPGSAFPADITNRYALLLQEQLQADGAAYDRYTEVLSNRTPVYEEVRFATHSAYGLCYIIPYCSSSGPTIEGAVYLPVGATCAEDGTVTFDGSLGTPVDMDAPTINRDAPFTERYTYSMPFKHLQDKGWNVDPDLLLYAELLDNNIIPLSPEDFPDGRMRTKSTEEDKLIIYMHYNSEYVGGRTDAVIGMHPDLLKRGIEHSLESMGFDLWNCTIQHSFLTMTITVPFSEGHEKVNDFIFCLMRNVERYLNLKNFSLYMHCTYELWEGTGSSSGSSGSSGSGGSGGSGGISGGSTGSSSSSSKIAPQGDLSKAIFNTASRLTAQQWEKVEKALEKINNDCLGGKLIGEVKATGIKIVHCDTMKANGSYKHSTKQLTIKDFKETDIDDRTFEKTLLHELIHSRQSGKVSSAMNQEIEVRIATRDYVKRNKIKFSSSHDLYIDALLSQLNSSYNVVDQDNFNSSYIDYIDYLKTIENYKNLKESPSERDLSTIKRLAQN